ncbi:MAG: asparaginase domain-containing protein [Acutalibacteraceae bacterium]|nr:asparaginase domain-containing protein [Acutalibacteraceae bacterium]
MKVLVILTGGTIACRLQSNVMDTNSDTAYDILRMYNSEYKNDIEFTVKQPFTILSENYTADTYNILIDYLYSCSFNEYDGVIITHGSDTLSYTSSLVGMLMCNAELPVLLTAADYPLSDEKSNGLSNFSACVEFIKACTCNGVFTVYGKKNEAVVYLSTRINESDPITDSFTPFGNGVVARVCDGMICNVNNDLIFKLNNSPDKRHSRFFTEKPVIENDILLIKTYPNQHYSRYSINGLKAVVIYTYHSATACTVGEDTDLCKFIKQCNDNNVDVYIASLKNRTDEYASLHKIEAFNINRLYNISKESAYIKALLAYNQSEYLPQKAMAQNIYFESDV